MWNGSARRLGLKAALVFASLGFVSAGHATTYLATFTGAVTTNTLPNDTDFPELFTTGNALFTVTFDDNAATAPGHDPAIGFGRYLSPSSIWTIQMGSFVTGATGGILSVHDGFLNADRFLGSVVDGQNGTISPGLTNGTLTLISASFGLSAVASSGNPAMFSSVDLPTTVFSGYTESQLTLRSPRAPGDLRAPSL